MTDHYVGKLRAGPNGGFGQGPVNAIFTAECPAYGDLVASLQTEPADPAMEANARRLVACWNACTGITTEQLQSDHDQGYEPWGHVQHLTTGRDALLDAMQEISRMSVGTTVGRTADAAISKVTGVKS